jgi:hypothetical protein
MWRQVADITNELERRHPPKRRLSRRKKQLHKWASEEDAETISLEKKKFAVATARKAYWYYSGNAKSARRRYTISEVLILLVSASVPILGILLPTNARPAAAVGAVVVALTGLRVVFHWHDNWTRFSLAANTLNNHIRLYLLGINPYAEDDKDQKLIEKVNDVERRETRDWAGLSSPGSAPGDNKKLSNQLPDDYQEPGQDEEIG